MNDIINLDDYLHPNLAYLEEVEDFITKTFAKIDLPSTNDYILRNNYFKINKKLPTFNQSTLLYIIDNLKLLMVLSRDDVLNSDKLVLKQILIYFSLVNTKDYVRTNFRYDNYIINMFIRFHISCTQYYLYTDALYDQKVINTFSKLNVNKINVYELLSLLFKRINFNKSKEQKVRDIITIINFYLYYYDSNVPLFNEKDSLNDIFEKMIKEMNGFDNLMAEKVYDLEYEIVFLLNVIHKMKEEKYLNIREEILSIDQKNESVFSKISEIITIIYEFYLKITHEGIVVLDLKRNI